MFLYMNVGNPLGERVDVTQGEGIDVHKTSVVLAEASQSHQHLVNATKASCETGQTEA